MLEVNKDNTQPQKGDSAHPKTEGSWVIGVEEMLKSREQVSSKVPKLA